MVTRYTLLEKFADYQKERAPNSYKNDVYYLDKITLHRYNLDYPKQIFAMALSRYVSNR